MAAHAQGDNQSVKRSSLYYHPGMRTPSSQIHDSEVGVFLRETKTGKSRKLRENPEDFEDLDDAFDVATRGRSTSQEFENLFGIMGSPESGNGEATAEKVANESKEDGGDGELFDMVAGRQNTQPVISARRVNTLSRSVPFGVQIPSVIEEEEPSSDWGASYASKNSVAVLQGLTPDHTTHTTDSSAEERSE